jgi:hypothetical protein
MNTHRPRHIPGSASADRLACRLGLTSRWLSVRQKLDGGGDGEAHDIEEVAFDAGDPAGGVALDAVGAGLVEGVAGGEVVGEVFVGDGGEENAGGFDVSFVGGGGDDSDAGVDLVDAVGEGAEHALGVGEVCGFVEDFVVGIGGENDGGVGAEDGGVGVEGVEGEGLLEGKALDVNGGEFVGVEGFVDVRGEDVEAQTGLGEEVAAAGGGGGEDEHF